MKKYWILIVLGVLCCAGRISAQSSHLVYPGDTWQALALSYGTDVQALNPQMNQQRQPTIGTEIIVPDGAVQMGKLVRTGDGGLLETAVINQSSPWAIALQNDLSHPYCTFFQR